MQKLLTILFLFSLQISFAQTTTYKNKSGNPVGYSKTNGNKTTYYNKSHNKTGTSKTTKEETIYYNRQGSKILTSKTK